MNSAEALELLIALLKHFALAPIKGTAGEVALGKTIDAQTKKLLKQVEDWTGAQAGQTALKGVIEKVERCFAQSNAPRELRNAIHQLTFQNEPALLTAIQNLPTALDDQEIVQAITTALKRDVGKRFSPEQIQRAVDAYLNCLRKALITLKDTAPTIIGQAVWRIEDTLKVVHENTEDIKVTVKEIKEIVTTLVQGITGLPFGYDTRIKNFLTDYLEAPFGGREEDMAALDTWLTTSGAPPYALLAAEAGRGKSALLVQWIQTVQTRNLAEIAFVPVSLRYNTAQATTVFTALAARLGAIYQEHTPYAQLSAEEWKGVCAKYLERTPPEGKPILVILDGLDEATDWQAGPDLFPVHPPAGVSVLISARYLAGDVDAKGWLNRLGWEKPGRARPFLLDYLTENGVRNVLEKMGNPLDKLATQIDVIHKLFRLSEGDPLLVRLYVEVLLPYGAQAAQLKPEDLTNLETGLGGFFDRWWEDQKKQWGKDNPLKVKYVSTTLNLLACALAPLSQTDILELAPPESELNTWNLEDALEALRRFVIGDGETQGYAFTHPRLGYYFYDKLKAEQIKWDKYFLDYGKRTLEILNQTPKDLPEFLSYPLQTYGAHLERAKRPPQEFYSLVSEGWMRAWYKLEGTYSGFLTDIDRAWKRADKEENIGVQIKCSLCISSVRTLSVNFHPELMVLALKYGLFSSIQGFVMIEQCPDESQRASLLIAVASSLPNHLFDKALMLVRTIQKEPQRARALIALVPYLTPDLLGQAFEIAQTIEDEIWCVRALVRLAPYLSVDLLHRALETTNTIRNQSRRTYILYRLAFHLAPDLQKTTFIRAVETAQSILPELSRIRAMTALVPHLPPELQTSTLHLALETVQAIWGENSRVEALTTLLPHLPPDLQTSTLHLALEKAQTISENGSRVKALTALLPHLPPDLQTSTLHLALETAQVIWGENSRVEALTALLPHLPPDLQTSTLRLALETAQSIRVVHLCARAITILAPHLPADLLRQAWKTAWDLGLHFNDLQALTAMVPHLPPDLLNEALEATQSITDKQLRAKIMIVFVPYLEFDLKIQTLRQVLATVQIIGSKGTLSSSLISLVPHLPPELIRIALETTLADEDVRYRICNLSNLVPHLSPDLQISTLRQALETIRNLRHEVFRVDLLTQIAPYLSHALLDVALEIVQNLRDEKMHAEALTVLALQLPYDQQASLLNQALAAQIISGHDGQHHALIRLASHLPSNVLRQVWSIAQAFRVKDVSGFVRILIELAPHLPLDLFYEAFESVQTIEDERVRARCLSGLAPFLPHSLLHAAFETILLIKDEAWYAYALIGLAPYLPLDLNKPTLRQVWITAMTIGDKAKCAQTLTALAPHLPPDLKTPTLHRAWKTALVIKDKAIQAKVLTELAPHLPTNQQTSTLEKALKTCHAIEDKFERANALTKLIPCQQTNRQWSTLYTALETAQAIGDRYKRTVALIDLAPLLIGFMKRDQEEGFLVWTLLLHALAHCPRSDVLDHLFTLHEVIIELAGNEKESTAIDIFHAIQEVCEWWP